MSISYQLRKQKINLSGKVREVVVASTIQKGEVTLEEIETMVAKISSASEGDVRSILRTLAELVAQNLAHGRIVDLGDLGRLRVNVKSKSADKLEEFSHENIKGLRVLYHPGKLIQKVKAQARIEHSPVKNLEESFKRPGLSTQP